MKRKILLVFSILLLFLISCGQDKNKDVDEQLTEPEYETTSVEAKLLMVGKLLNRRQTVKKYMYMHLT